MNSDQLFYFKKVAELEHMSKAAERLYISQTRLSRSIASLERELGVPLFDRVGRGIKLNEAGKIFYRYVLKILGQYNDARARVREAYLHQSCELLVGTNASAYMPGLLVHLSKQLPDVNLRQFSAPRNKLAIMLKSGRIDFAITSPPMRDLETDCVRIGIETPVVICPKNHRLFGKKSISLQDLEGENLVGVPDGYGARDAMEEHYREYGINPQFIVETSDTRSVEEYVFAGLGIAVVPKSLIRTSNRFADSYIEFEEDLPCILGLSWRRGESSNDVKNRFFEIAVDYFSHSLGSGCVNNDGNSSLSFLGIERAEASSN